MATTIDIENAKQIRQPMDVVIEMNVPDTSVTLTYSGYFTTSKISDGELDEPTWPMRGLADLQGQGFPLDGSRELYDSGVTPSEANGKIGVRGNIGQSVNVTVRGNKTIASLFVHATGAESITFGSTTTPIINNVVTIPVGATSITLTLNPASATERIEISEIGAGARFSITNENLIRATVSLRSDLSIVNPTLPESELNVEVYQDTDVSEAVAAIPEDTPITYSAGYPGDMSPTRKFYVTGQVTWADNVLSIQAVDAVHLLDYETPSFFVGVIGISAASAIFEYIVEVSRALVGDVIADTDAYQIIFNTYTIGTRSALIIPEGLSIRDIIAHIVNVMRWDYITPDYFSRWAPSGISKMKVDYVDAGIPAMRFVTNPPMWAINEEDCGDIQKNVERKISRINYTYANATPGSGSSATHGTGLEVGTATWTRGIGASLKFDEYVYEGAIGLPSNQVPGAETSLEKWASVVPAKADGDSYFFLPTSNLKPFEDLRRSAFIGPVIGPNTKNGDTVESGVSVLSQFVAWSYNCKWLNPVISQSTMWSRMVAKGTIPSDAQEAQLVIFGHKSEVTEYEGTIVSGSSEGVEAEINVPLKGIFYFADESETVRSEAYPKNALSQLLSRSNKTGSVKWKGDPRMQPRDNATITMRDGTQKVVTLENITLTHERGGLSAEITYREGAV